MMIRSFFLRGFSSATHSVKPISKEKLQAAREIFYKKYTEAHQEISKNPNQYYYDYIGKTEADLVSKYKKVTEISKQVLKNK